MNKQLKTYIETHKPHNCIEKVKHKIITFKDKGSTSLHLSNDNEQLVYKIRVDNCLIKDKTSKKCDWIACLENNDKVMLIELKSKKLEFTTIVGQFTQTRDKIELENKDCFCLLAVLKKLPQNNPQRRKFSNAMKKQGLRFETVKYNEERSITEFFF